MAKRDSGSDETLRLQIRLPADSPAAKILATAARVAGQTESAIAKQWLLKQAVQPDTVEEYRNNQNALSALGEAESA